MHEHDLDLVAALADGSLDGDTDAIEALVATCQVCGDEYRAQTAIRSLLSDLPTMHMTDAERASLRAGVDATLPSPAPELSPLPAPRRASPWWWRLVPAAGAAVLVLAIGGVLTGGSGESGDAFQNISSPLTAEGDAGRSSGTTAASGETTTTVEAAESIESLSGQQEADEETGGDGGGAEVPSTTVPEDAAGELPEADVASRHRAGLVGSIEELVALLTDPERDVEEFVPDVEFQCIEAASQPPVDGITGEVESVAIELFVLPAEGDQRVLEAFSPPACTPVDLPG